MLCHFQSPVSSLKSPRELYNSSSSRQAVLADTVVVKLNTSRLGRFERSLNAILSFIFLSYQVFSFSFLNSITLQKLLK